MTQEQEKALKVCEKLVSCMTDHTLSAEEIMVLIQGILSNECGNSCYTPLYIPQHQETTPYIRPGDVWCQNSTSNIAYFKNEKEMIEEARKTLEKNGDPIIPTTQELIKNDQWEDVGEKQPGICAGDNIPDMQQVIH